MDLSHDNHELDDKYVQLFVEFVKRSVGHSLVAVRSSTISPSAEVLDQARHVLSFALDLDSAHPIVYDLLLDLAPKMEAAGHRDDWLTYLERGICHSRDQAHFPITAKLLIYSGMIHQLQGRFAQAQICFQESIDLATASKDSTLQARAMIRLAFVERLRYRPDQAANLAQRALALLPSDHLEQAAAYAVLGTVAYDRKEWPQSVAHFRQALVIAQQQDEPRNLARRLRDLGMVLRRSEDLSSAVDIYVEAIDLFDRLGDRVQGAITRLNLSAVYLDQKQPTASLDLCTEAEAPLYDAHDHVHLAHLAYNRGLAHLALDQPTTAAHHLQNAADRYARLDRPADRAEALAELGRLR